MGYQALSVTLEPSAVKTWVIFPMRCNPLQAWGMDSMRHVVRALQPLKFITPAPDAPQASLLQELRIIPNARLISHIRHV